MTRDQGAPRLCADLPGTGGAFKRLPEDFVVEEIPAYLPSGNGEHTFFWVEKRGLSTQEAVQRLAAALGADAQGAGTAGQKDKQALTRQWISLPRAEPKRVDLPGLRVLEAARHGNKLRTGHLRGNRFTVTVRGVAPDAATRAQAILDRLTKLGLPNFYGQQRFGRDNVARGRALLLGELRVRDRFERRLLLSALQSSLFNEVLARRMEAGTHRRVLAGDVMEKVESGGRFVSTDPAADQARLERWEIQPTGPMFGPKMMQPAPHSEPAALEQAVLEEAKLGLADFGRGGNLAEGTRRPLSVPVGDAAVVAADNGFLTLRFALPPGSYATVLLAEIIG